MKTPSNHLVSPALLDESFEGKTGNLNMIYQDESQCIEAFRKFKLQSRIHCKECDIKDFPLQFSTNQFKCKSCGHLSGLRCGTILEDLNLPVSYLFIAVHVLLKHNNTATAAQLQQITGYVNAESFSLIIGKIRDELDVEKQASLLIYFLESLDSDVEYVI